MLVSLLKGGFLALNKNEFPRKFSEIEKEYYFNLKQSRSPLLVNFQRLIR